MTAVFEGASPDKPPLNTHAPYAGYYGEPEQRVTIWNKVEGRKLSGNSAPFRKNLADYIRKHPVSDGPVLHTSIVSLELDTCF